MRIKYPKDKPGNCLIYAALHPLTKQVVYIGQTGMSLRDRATLHLHSGKNKTPFSKWVQCIRQTGLKPLFVDIDQVPGNDAIYWERFYIQLFRSWGFNILNVK